MAPPRDLVVLASWVLLDAEISANLITKVLYKDVCHFPATRGCALFDFRVVRAARSDEPPLKINSRTPIVVHQHWAQQTKQLALAQRGTPSG